MKTSLCTIYVFSLIVSMAAKSELSSLTTSFSSHRNCFRTVTQPGSKFFRNRAEVDKIDEKTLEAEFSRTARYFDDPENSKRTAKPSKIEMPKKKIVMI